jgi:hypothetical protein
MKDFALVLAPILLVVGVVIALGGHVRYAMDRRNAGQRAAHVMTVAPGWALATMGYVGVAVSQGRRPRD